MHFAAGVADIPKRMEAQVKSCPNIKFSLVGFSQGGGVLSAATAALPPDLAEKVVAVILYGSGDGSSIQGPLNERTLANCAPGDFVSFSINFPKLSPCY